MNKLQREAAKKDIFLGLKAEYPEGHMPISDAADKIGTQPRKLPNYGVVSFRFKKGKRCRIEYVADAMAEQQGL